MARSDGMARSEGQSLGRRRLLTAIPLLGGASMCGISVTWAHNNPGFKEVLLSTVDIHAEPVATGTFMAYSEPFSLDLPKKTIELIWRVADGVTEGVTFSVAQGDALHAEALTDGASSRILRGGDVRIIDVAGASGPFSIAVYANVIDRSRSEGS